MKKKTFLFFPVGVLLCAAIITGCDENDENGRETSDYFYHEGHSYQIVEQNKTWAEAAIDAASRGGYLVEIGSKAEQDVIWQAIQQSGISPTYTKVQDGGGIGYIWIGAADKATEGGWIWNGANRSGTFTVFWFGNQSGVAVNGAYANWGGTASGKRNEPDNYTHSDVAPNGQDAAAIGLANWPEGSSRSEALGVAGEWNDIAETNRLYYIIEYDMSK